jgi:hypothetical protein
MKTLKMRVERDAATEIERIVIEEMGADREYTRSVARGIARRIEALRSQPQGIVEPGWWHPTQCTNEHDSGGNCLDAEGYVVGWREQRL